MKFAWRCSRRTDESASSRKARSPHSRAELVPGRMPTCGTMRVAARNRCWYPEGDPTATDRPELSSMADSYARHALSQRAAFEVTHPAALAAARLFADEPVLRVVDLGAADGVNSHGLIRALMEERAGRRLVYALVDLPTNAWAVAADH